MNWKQSKTTSLYLCYIGFFFFSVQEHRDTFKPLQKELIKAVGGYCLGIVFTFALFSRRNGDMMYEFELLCHDLGFYSRVFHASACYLHQ